MNTSNLQFGGHVLSTPLPVMNVPACVEPAGKVVEGRKLLNTEVREHVYGPGTHLVRHWHDHAYLSFVLEGHYSETYHQSSEFCGSGTVRFLPAGEIHSNLFEEGARCLLIEVPTDTLHHLREHGTVLERSGQLAGPKVEWLAKRLYSEFRQRDTAATVALEGIVLEMLAEGARSEAGLARSAPRWLNRAKEMIHARFLEVPSLTEIAQEAGVHPVHLSREFRRYFQTTVGEYMRKLRIEHASHLLANTSIPLSEIATICGFADQSHFSSTFKRTVGVTPARFREMQG